MRSDRRGTRRPLLRPTATVAIYLLLFPLAQSKAQTVADKKAEIQAAAQQQPTMADSVRTKVTLDSLRVRTYQAAAQADSLRLVAKQDSSLAEARSDTIALHAVHDSLDALKGAPGIAGSPAANRTDTLQKRADSLQASGEAARKTEKAQVDSLSEQLKRSKSALDSALDAQKKQNATRDSIAKALAADTSVNALNPTQPFVERHVPDPERDHYFDDRDANFLNASVIKSIAGEKPADEFFDLKFRIQILDSPSSIDTVTKQGQPRVRVRGSWSLFTLSAIDVALSATNDSATSDSVRRERKKVTEATVAIEVGFPPTTRVSGGKAVRFRRFYMGPFMKVFNTEPYYGVNLGSVELEASSFRSSYVYAGFLRRFYPDSLTHPNNLFFEFFLRSSNVDFFKVLSLRGGVLFPLGPGVRSRDIESRIAIEVPIVSWPF
jgi:hypothetical protein